MKFIGHLDIMRYFQKAVKRAGLDAAYSEGFSPHMIMSFAAPLGVGITSEGEYFDLELKTPVSSKKAVERLNQVMVEGMEVLSVREVPEGKKRKSHVFSGCCRLPGFFPGRNGAWRKLAGKNPDFYGTAGNPYPEKNQEK